MIFMLDDTIRKNVAFGVPEDKIDEDRLWEVLKEAQLDEFIKTLPEGLETGIGERGIRLSGGQRQALALLMATMTPIDFLILDEHTAALDPKTAEIIMELTDQVVKEKKVTTIMVTHNLRYAVEYGNRLIMMHEGKAILDKAGEEKKTINTEEIMAIFNRISVECGN